MTTPGWWGVHIWQTRRARAYGCTGGLGAIGADVGEEAGLCDGRLCGDIRVDGVAHRNGAQTENSEQEATHLGGVWAAAREFILCECTVGACVREIFRIPGTLIGLYTAQLGYIVMAEQRDVLPSHNYHL